MGVWCWCSLTPPPPRQPSLRRASYLGAPAGSPHLPPEDVWLSPPAFVATSPLASTPGLNEIREGRGGEGVGGGSVRGRGHAHAHTHRGENQGLGRSGLEPRLLRDNSTPPPSLPPSTRPVYTCHRCTPPNPLATQGGKSTHGLNRRGGGGVALSAGRATNVFDYLKIVPLFCHNGGGGTRLRAPALLRTHYCCCLAHTGENTLSAKIYPPS